MDKLVKNNDHNHAFSYFVPQADVLKNEKELKIILDLPGIKKENIEIISKNNLLTISGHFSSERANEKEVYHEFRYGNFQRSFQLDETVDTESIQATNKDGVLTISLPIILEKAPKKIVIN